MLKAQNRNELKLHFTLLTEAGGRSFECAGGWVVFF